MAELVFMFAVALIQLALIAWISYCAARRYSELEEKLVRYRDACSLVRRWNASVKNSSETADWIAKCGEGSQAMDIQVFRIQLQLACMEEHLQRDKSDLKTL